MLLDSVAPDVKMTSFGSALIIAATCWGVRHELPRELSLLLLLTPSHKRVFGCEGFQIFQQEREAWRPALASMLKETSRVWDSGGTRVQVNCSLWRSLTGESENICWREELPQHCKFDYLPSHDLLG
jgi:hypothetical protein